MIIENIAADIIEKFHELVRDSKLNAQDTVTGIIKNGLDEMYKDKQPSEQK